MSIERERRKLNFVRRWLKVGLSDETVDSLSRFPFLSGLTAHEVEIFGTFLERREIEAGVNLFLAGDRGLTLFMLETGSVDILKPLPDGSEKRLTTFTDKSFIGEIALLSDIARTATARSTAACKLWLLYREDFERLCKLKPPVAIKILWSLAAEMGLRLARTNEMVANLAMERKQAMEKAAV